MEGMSKMEKKKGEMGLMTSPNIEMVGTTSDDVHGHGHDPPLRSESSSSIGQPDDDADDDEEEEEVQSTLSSLASLEDSLPIKKGLSKFYGGKSKSYGNLGEVKSLEDLGKSDNPFNKRRRTLLAYNLMFSDHSSSSSSSSSSGNSNKAALFYAHSNHLSMPLLPLAEDDDDDHNHDNDNDNDHYIPYPVNAITSVAAPTSPS